MFGGFRRLELTVKIVRNVPISLHRFRDFFVGFEKLDVVRRIFGEKTEEVLDGLSVEFGGFRGYMGVSDVDGHLLVSALYLRNGDLVDIYLDVVHELVHVRQFLEGKELFDHRFGYVERPTELEAYRLAVDEARRLGLSEQRICEYLRTEWMSDREFERLARALKVDCKVKPRPRKRGS